MSNDIRAELDTLHAKVEALSAELASLTQTQAGRREPTPARRPAGPPDFPGAAALWAATEPLARRADELGARGLATFAGC